MTCSGRTEWASVHRDACEQLFAGGGASRLNPWRRSSVAKWCLWSWTVSAYWDVPRHTPRLHLEPRGDRMHIDLLCHNHVLKRRRHKARISETPGNNLPSFILTLSGRVAATDECLLRELDPRCHGQTKKMWALSSIQLGINMHLDVVFGVSFRKWTVCASPSSWVLKVTIKPGRKTLFATVNQHHFRAVSSEIIMCLNLLNLIRWEFMFVPGWNINCSIFGETVFSPWSTDPLKPGTRPGAPTRLKSVPNISIRHRLRYRCLASPQRWKMNKQISEEMVGPSMISRYFSRRSMKRSCSPLVTCVLKPKEMGKMKFTSILESDLTKVSIFLRGNYRFSRVSCRFFISHLQARSSEFQVQNFLSELLLEVHLGKKDHPHNVLLVKIEGPGAGIPSIIIYLWLKG